MCTYLAKREAIYYFRRPVPEELRPYLDNRREWILSLHTKDRETAKQAIPRRTIATDALINEARDALRLDMAELATRVAQPGDGIPEAPTEPSPAEREQAAYEAQEAAAKVARWEARAPERLIARRRRHLGSGDLDKREQAMRDVFEEEKEALRTRYREKRPAVQAVEQHPAPLPLLEVFDAYAKEQQLKPSTASEWRNNLDALVTFLGHSDAQRITVDDLDRWRDMLLATPTKRGTVRLPRSVNNHYFVALRATLAWAVEKRKLTTNVATQVIIRIPKRAKLREQNFTTIESTAILAATLLPVSSTASNYTKLARRWIPWLCAYTGARVNEIGQLRGNDIAQIDGLWSIRITPEAGTQKGNTARIIPLHSHLVDQGFLAIPEKAGELPIFYDPAAVRKPGDGNRYVKKVGERLAAWVRNDVGITDTNLQPNHAWRHTFKTMAIDAGMMERVSDAITGHAAKTVGQTYGSVSLKAMSAAVEQLPVIR